jgi:hypothetical protein
MKKIYREVVLLGLIFVIAGCASAPKLANDHLNFFPDTAAIYGQINLPKFRSLIKQAVRKMPKSNQKSINQLAQFTGQLSFYWQSQTFMVRAIGFYPQSTVLKQLGKNPDTFNPTQTNTFRINTQQWPSERDIQLQIPSSGHIYLSNQLPNELARIARRTTPSVLPVAVQRAFSSNQNAAIYIPNFSTMLSQFDVKLPIPIAAERLLLVIEPSGGNYTLRITTFFGNSDLDNRKLIAQSRFIGMALASNESLGKFSYSVEEDGVQFVIVMKTKDLLKITEGIQNWQKQQQATDK